MTNCLANAYCPTEEAEGGAAGTFIYGENPVDGPTTLCPRSGT